jgi:Tol biopolymer transport system component
MPRGWRPGGGGLLVEDPDGRTSILAADGTPTGGVNGGAATWSPSGGQIAYLRDDVLYVADAVGGGERAFDGVRRPSWDVTGPVWSPDGKQILIATVQGLAVFQVDGSGERTIFNGANQSVNPSWSADGRTIAFERNDGPHWTIWFVAPDGSDPHAVTEPGYNSRFPQWAPVGSRLALISDRLHVPGGATQYQFSLYVQEPGASRPVKALDDVHPQSPPRWSPTGAQIADAAGQECRRWGVYVVNADSLGRRRASNLCRFAGTAGDDVLRGTSYLDIVGGFAGDDRIVGNAGNDRIEGNAGDDSIDAGPGDDAVFGGPGDDTIVAGSGRDLIVGGPGRDSIAAGAGSDRIETRDGFRDLIDCGNGNDTAEVDRLDVVRHCERVLRP